MNSNHVAKPAINWFRVVTTLALAALLAPLALGTPDKTTGQTAPTPSPAHPGASVGDGWVRFFKQTLGGEIAYRYNERTGEIQQISGVMKRPNYDGVRTANRTDSATGADSAAALATINVPGRPHGIAVNPAANRAYVTSFDNNVIHAIDLTTNAVVATTTVGTQPHSVAVDTSTGRVYVTNLGASTVSVVNGATNAVLATVPIGGNPVGIDVDRARQRAYAVNAGVNLTPINSANTAEPSIDTGGSNGYVAVNSSTAIAYVSKNNPNGQLAVVNLATKALTGTIPLGGHVSDLAVNETTQRVYVANDANNTVDVIEGRTSTRLTSISVGSAPSDVAVNPNTNCVFVANENSNTVTVIDGATNSVMGYFAVGSGPKAIAVNPQTNRVYVANKDGSSVTVEQITGCAAPIPASATPTPSGTVQPTPPATLPESTEVFNRKVFVLVFDPRLQSGQLLRTVKGWRFHGDITRDTIAFYKNASRNRLNYTVVDTGVAEEFPVKLDGFRYTAESWLAAEAANAWHTPDEMNYVSILSDPRWDLCGKANRNEIDEVWIYNGPYFGFYESTLAGTGAYFFNSPPVSGAHGCTRLLPIMGPSPERSIGEAIHNFGHRTESTMRRAYGSWDSLRPPTHNWEKFAIAKVNSGGAVNYSGCGTFHEPPNAAQGYDYSNPGNATLSNCDAFNAYPNVQSAAQYNRLVTCADWGCTDTGFYNYWFQRMPRFTGCTDQFYNDWWRYFVFPELANSPATQCQSVPTTVAPTTVPTTPRPTTAVPTTAVPTTPRPTTAVPATAVPTTAVPTTPRPTTAVPPTVVASPTHTSTPVIPSPTREPAAPTVTPTLSVRVLLPAVSKP